MPHQNTVFSQITHRLPWGTLDTLVAEHRADKGVWRLPTKALLLTPLFGQLSGAQSLREIEAILESHDARRYHARLPAARRATIADALHTRPAAVFAGVLSSLVAQLNGKVLRILTNDLVAPAREIADLYKRRWAEQPKVPRATARGMAVEGIELFFRWI